MSGPRPPRDRAARDAKVAARYLERYAEPEAHDVAGRFTAQRFAHVLVVPCYAETAGFVERLGPARDPANLTVAVVNAPDRGDPALLAASRALLTALRGRDGDNLLIIDRVSRPLPHRQGVGLARKIGADVALALINAGIVRSPRIFLTDADVILPQDYFAAADAAGNDAVLLYPYRHFSPTPALARRAELYELHMRAYVWRLARAGSPYAFPTLGSIVAVSATAYAQVRGVPRRNAGEDFHLLNKLAKVGAVVRLAAPVIDIEARLSTRVPFGTGPALAKLTESPETFLSYAAASFRSLAGTLAALDEFCDAGRWREPPGAEEWLHTLGWEAFARHIGSLRPEERRRRVRDWFDALRTLRFLHLARSRYPDEPLLPALRAELPGSHRASGPTELLTALRHT